uniref:Uncharacterized protein n=1 Tax=Avena sativa TaxID=4498 RepID=A0ACD5UIZ0_AVESA
MLISVPMFILESFRKAMAARDAQTSSGENNRVKYAVAWLKGSQVPMQDAHTAMLDLDGSNSRSFFGVFDGHGGDTVALYCSEQFHAELIQDPDYKTNLQTAMLRMYFRADEKLKASDKWRKPPSSKGKLQRCMDSDLCGVCQLWKKPYTGPQEEGSTACVAIIEGNRILVANAGDSRCVLSRNGEAIDLSTDHKPNVEDEKKRIQAAGGQVLKNEMSKIKLGEFAELGIPRVDGKLLISRSIGDLAYKQDETLIPEQQKVTCNPDIFSVDITDDIDFLLIATNGIWYVLN